MKTKFWQIWALSPVFALIAAINPAQANDSEQSPQPSVTNLDTPAVSMQTLQGQVTSVSQLTDVRPTDWAFQALQSLVERYGCIVGYPDRTFRGNRAITRYEFAAGLNACLDRINELIAAGTAELATKEDLATLQRLQEEFAAELATLRGRVDALEVRTATLEKQQFSTTTKLNGEVIFAVAGVAAGENVRTGNDVDRNPVFGDRVRLEFDTSFTGRDLLRTRLQTTNLAPFSAITGTFEGDFQFAGEDNNDIVVDALLYEFPLGDRTTVVIEANAGAVDDFTDTFNPLDGDGGSGALTVFGTRNPIYFYLDGAGIGVRHEFSDAFELSLGYLAADPANPASGGGLFNGPYGAIAQLTVKPSDRFKFGLTYVHSYNTETGTGSNLSNFRTRANDLFGVDVPIVSNSVGLGASWTISQNFILSGWAGYTNTNVLSTAGILDRGSLNILNWTVAAAFPDVGKRGAMAGIIVGMEPKVIDSSVSLIGGNNLEDDDTSLHIEAFYQYPISDNLAITPAIIWLTNPDHNNDNSDIVIGVVRATFTF